MYPSDWTVLPVEPCDAIALDSIENLTDAKIAALVSAIPDAPPDDRATALVATRERFGAPGWRHHTPTPSIPDLHLTA